MTNANPESESIISDATLVKAQPMLRPRGRPRLSNPKQRITIRYDADIVTYFKAFGKGWQTKMNEALHDWIKQR